MKAHSREIPSYLTKKELDRFIDKLPRKRHQLGCAFMAYAGLRVSEMNSLRVKDVNLARGFIRVFGKGDKIRVVPLTSKLTSFIESFLGSNNKLNPDSFLLGKTRGSWHYVVKRYSQEILGKDDISCHSLRHSYATALYESGVQIERVSELLGHARLDTTMIYAHISMSKKREAVSVLDSRSQRLKAYVMKKKNRFELSVVEANDVIARENELKELSRFIEKQVSVLIYGRQGSGKSAVMRQLKDAIYIAEFKKKQTLIQIIADSKNIEGDIRKELYKDLKKLTVEELIIELEEVKKVIVFDDITDCSKSDKKLISKIAENNIVIAATSNHKDKQLFQTFIELKSLKRYHTRLIISDMIQMTDHKKKEAIVDDILHTAGENLKEAEYIASQLQLGKTTEEITTVERQCNQVSLSPILLIVMLFFFAILFKSYTASAVALGYALMVVFRMIFARYLFTPATR